MSEGRQPAYASSTVTLGPSPFVTWPLTYTISGQGETINFPFWEVILDMDMKSWLAQELGDA